jgi:hypothetical protein
MRARGMSARPLDVAVKATHMAIEMEPDGQERQALGQALSILLKIQNMHVSRNQQALQQRARP